MVWDYTYGELQIDEQNSTKVNGLEDLGVALEYGLGLKHRNIKVTSPMVFFTAMVNTASQQIKR